MIMDLIRKKKGNIEEEYDSAGNLLYRGTFTDDGMSEGFLQSWYPNGVLKSETHVRNNRPVGEINYYYEDGQLRSRLRFNNDNKPDGLWEHWYPNGQLSEQTEYKSDIFGCTTRRWDEAGRETYRSQLRFDARELGHHYNGQLSFVRNYDLQGNVEGLFERFNDRGQLIYSGIYVSGRPIGIHKEWYDSGALLAESRYGSNGVLKEEKLYSELGHLTSDKVELMGCYLNEMFGEDGSLIKRSVDDVSGNPLYKNQIKGHRLSKEQKMALEYYQPVRVKEGWLQLGMDGRARCFSADPAFIIDEVHVLAKKLEPALRKQFECDGVDPDKYIHIKVDVPINGQRTTLGNIQSLIQEKESKKSHGIRM